MTDKDGPLNPQLSECLMQQFGLRWRHPGAQTWALAIAEAGSVEDDDAVIREQALSDAARVVVIARYRVPVQQHHGWPITPVAVMQPDPIDHQK